MRTIPSALHVEKELRLVATASRAKSSAWFFKTGHGEYGEGDVFVGVTVPMQRKIASAFYDISYDELALLLNSKIHECRLVALFILVHKYQKGDTATQTAVYNFYISHLDRVNNWDLVDSSAPHIIGAYKMMYPEKKALLYTLARSRSIWERRVAVLSTFMFIKYQDYTDALAIGEILLHDSEDLIHKATGWMLREVGKKSIRAEENFLVRHYKSMPRTMLRYAIEKFPKEKRLWYLTK